MIIVHIIKKNKYLFVVHSDFWRLVVSSYKKIGIIGAGCYGTAIAQCISYVIAEVVLLSDSENIANEINNHKISPVFCDILLNNNISCTTDYKNIKDSDLIFIVVPVSSVISVCENIKRHAITSPIILCSKGIDANNVCLLSDTVEKCIKNEIAIFSGPSFAEEINSGLPASVNVSSKSYKLALDIEKNVSSDKFKIKAISDYIGLQIAGAFKNVLAIGCGIADGLNLGRGAIAQLIVKGISDMCKLSEALGGKKDTFLDFGGIGDIILTCMSNKSRNVLFGRHIASGGRIDNWNGNLAEGAFSAKAIPLFESKYSIKMEAMHEIYDTIYR